MPSPYANPYGDLTKVNVQGPSTSERRKAKSAGASADLLRLLGGVAPAVGGIAGTAIGAGLGSLAGGIGAAPGAAIGGAIGGGAGSMLGAGLGYGADKQVEPYEEADMARRRRLDAIKQVLGSL
jgi:hypothetical protein